MSRLRRSSTGSPRWRAGCARARAALRAALGGGRAAACATADGAAGRTGTRHGRARRERNGTNGNGTDGNGTNGNGANGNGTNGNGATAESPQVEAAADGGG